MAKFKQKFVKHPREYAGKNSPKVSITIPCYNKAPYVAEAIEKADGYKPDMAEGSEDWDLWLSLIENRCDVYRIDEVLFKYRRSNEPTRNDLTKGFMR